MLLLPVVVVAAVLAAVQAVRVPGPTGPYPVAMRVQQLTDQRRLDPYAPPGRPHKRRILVSVFLPLDPGRFADGPVQSVPYMPPRTAALYGDEAVRESPLPRDFFSRLTIDFSQFPKNGSTSDEGHRRRYPVVLFSHGLGGSRLLHTAAARDIASQGYVVMTIDHPYDASYVEFPDGSEVRGANISTMPAIIRSVQVRAADVSFLVDQLHDSAALQRLTAGMAGGVDADKVVVCGHSLGGATSAAVMANDSRIAGGLDLDGHIIGPVADEGFDRPFALVGKPGRGQTAGSKWPELYSRLRGPKMELAVAETEHLSFFDVPLLLTTAKVADGDRPRLDAALGRVNGRRLRGITMGIFTAFLDLVFRGKADGLRNLDKDFCGVSVVKSELPQGS
ncbi:hypothetical protein CDD83_10998 [Cordyceps sp. RAO-2017]|nr:hypothetical protein CDD83_10998 [Cordyceps sp. RAO-2017]